MSAKHQTESAEEPPPEDAAPPPEVAKALDAVRNAMEHLAALLGTEPGAALDALKQAGQTASDNLASIAGDARDMGREGLDDLSAAVRRNPLAWLAAAAGVGLVVGLWRNRGGRS